MAQGSEHHKGGIIVVDDTPENLKFLTKFLADEGYKVRPAPDGKFALSEAHRLPPDLILLDVNMPKMNGFEVCRQLKATPLVQEIPVIFLTACTNPEDLKEGFNAGGVDYVTKPFNNEELFARVQTHISLYKSQQEIKTKQLQLLQSEKMASLGTLVAGIAHEVNNPIHSMNITAHNLDQTMKGLHQLIYDLAEEGTDQNFLDLFEERFKKIDRHLEILQEGSLKIKNIVQDLRTFSRLDEAERKQVDFVENLRSTIRLIHAQYPAIDFVEDFQIEPHIECWPAQLNQVFMNIMTNGCQAMEAKEEGTLTIRIQQHLHELAIQFQDTGCGMSEAVQSQIFDPFFTTKDVGEGTGLGMSTAYGIIEKHQGRFEIQSELKKGTIITIFLPFPSP